MTDELTIFGKVMDGDIIGRRLRFGIFLFDIGIWPPKPYKFKASLTWGFGYIESVHNTKQSARDWLESEARRIMRECLEIAGEVAPGTGWSGVVSRVT